MAFIIRAKYKLLFQSYFYFLFYQLWPFRKKIFKALRFDQKNMFVKTSQTNPFPIQILKLKNKKIYIYALTNLKHFVCEGTLYNRMT